MTNEPTLGFTLSPQSAGIDFVHGYLVDIKERFPKAKTLVSTLQVNNGSKDPRVKDNPAITFATACNERQDLVARAYILLGAARTFELDYLFFNFGLKRYDVDTLSMFAKNSIEQFPYTDLVIGEPPILRSAPSTEELKALQNQKVRQRLLVDILINYILCRSLGIGFINMNAGIFRLNLSNKEVLRTLASVHDYYDSSLVCSQIAWHLKNSGFVIKSIPVGKIHLGELGFKLDKAVQEIAFIIKMIAYKFGGDHIPLRSIISDFLNEKEYWNRWVEKNRDGNWLLDVVVPRVEKITSL